MIQALFTGILVTMSASPAISLVAKVTAVLALGLISVWFARKSRAAVRHALLASTFSVMLALPIVSLLATPVLIAVPVVKADVNSSPLFGYIAEPSYGEPAVGRLNPVPANPGWSLPPISTLFFYGWLIGAVLFMVLIVRALLQVRSLRRCGLPWRHGQAMAEGMAPAARRAIEVLLHESFPGPMTCGVLNPVIFLPADAPGWDKRDLERALVHELEHVRRYDWAIHCLARTACAAYWFHPMVWVAWRQLTLEAERSCDDAVLRSSEATAYADQLVALARRRSVVRESPVLAMASRSDLAARVGALLDVRQRRGPVGTVLVAGACITVAAIILTVSPLRMVAAPQSPHDGSQLAASGPTFDVASVKQSGNLPRVRGVSGRMMGGPGTNDPGRITYTQVALAQLLMKAWGIPESSRISAPSWVLNFSPTDLYTVTATMPPNTAMEKFQVMLQNLLLERFRMKVHSETKYVDGYDLMVAPGGPKLKRAADPDLEPTGRILGDIDPQGFSVLPPGHGAMVVNGEDDVRAKYQSYTIAQFLGGPYDVTGFLRQATGVAGIPVLDKTGLTEKYDFTLAFDPTRTGGQSMTPEMRARLESLTGVAPEARPPSGLPSLFDAVEKQLGIKLVKTKTPVETLVVEHVEKVPIEN